MRISSFITMWTRSWNCKENRMLCRPPEPYMLNLMYLQPRLRPLRSIRSTARAAVAGIQAILQNSSRDANSLHSRKPVSEVGGFHYLHLLLLLLVLRLIIKVSHNCYLSWLWGWLKSLKTQLTSMLITNISSNLHFCKQTISLSTAYGVLK